MERNQATDQVSLSRAAAEAASPHPHDVHMVGFDGHMHLKRRFGNRRRWWRRKRFWLTLIVVLLVIAAVSWFFMPARFWLLNTSGVKAGYVVAVYDEKTKAIIRDAEIELDGRRYRTSGNDDMHQAAAVIRDARFGPQQLTVRKDGYRPFTQQVTVANLASQAQPSQPHEVRLIPTGQPMRVKVQHWLHGQGLSNAQVTYGDTSVLTNQEGLATFYVPPSERQKEASVTVKADNFLPQTIKIKPGTNATTEIEMVAVGKQYFLSQRTGVLSVYGCNLDGSEVRQIVKGTGKEQAATTELHISPDQQKAVLISSRSGRQAPNGQLLLELHVIDVNNGAITKVDEALQIAWRGWLGTHGAYVRDVAKRGSAEKEYQEVMSLDIRDRQKRSLAQADSFAGVVVARDRIFFVPSGTVRPLLKNNEPGLQSITADERQKLTIFNEPITRMARTKFAVLTYEKSNGEVVDFNLVQNVTTDLTAMPTDWQTRQFVESTNGQRVAWLEPLAPGGAALMVGGTLAGTATTTVHQAPQLVEPVRWLQDDLLLFRQKSANLATEYVISLTGGEAKKVNMTTAP